MRTPPFELWLGEQLGHSWPASFDAPLRYPVFGGGKRMRPLFTLAAYEAITGSDDPSRAWPGAAAVELIHTYSLVHDDLPCMDDDDERRGRPTVHVAYDEATAVLVGDALLTHAFAVLAAAEWPASAVVRAVALLAERAGHLGMVGGQVGDIAVGASAVGLDTIARVHALKTGALIRAAVGLGGLAAEADEATMGRLDDYATAVGLAFQLADDVLDADEDQGEDGPPSFVRALGVDETRRRARAAADEAIAAVSGLAAPAALVALADYTVDRSH